MASSNFENRSERLNDLVNRAADLLADIGDTPERRVMEAGTVEAEPLRLLREAIELNRALVEDSRERNRRYDEALAEQRREACLQGHEAAVQSRKMNILSLVIAALSLLFAIAAVFAPYIWPQP